MKLASGKMVFKFWPDQRSEDYLRRVARHIDHQKEPIMTSRAHAQKAHKVSTIPSQFYAQDVLEAVEIALFYGDVFLQEMNRQARANPVTATRATRQTGNTSLATSTSNLHRDETFFNLFNQGIHDLTEACPPQIAFAKLNAAFEHLKILLTADHPIVFYRLAAILFSCREYPDSDISRKVCRLLAVHLLQLGRVVMGPGHPIIHWWATGIKLLDSGQWEYVDKFLQSAQRLGSKYIAYVPGTVDLITYAPSDMRGLKDDVLRDKVNNIALDISRVSETQEARLCLSELLLGQGEVREGLHVLREALTFRHLDLDKPACKAFWFSELFSRAGEIDAALEMLKEATELVKGEEGVGEAAFSIALDEVQTSDSGDVLLIKRRALEQGIRMFQTHAMYERHK